MRKYWLVLYPDTFLWHKGGIGLIYNSNNFKWFSFMVTVEIAKLCDVLTDLDNLYAVEITELLLDKKNIIKWIDNIKSINAGCLVEQRDDTDKPVSYYPFLSIQNGMEQIKWEHKLGIGGGIIENLHELIFYVNGSENGSDEYYKQTYYPMKTGASLDFKKIEEFIHKCNNKMLTQLCFIGDFNCYEDYDQLKEWLFSNDYFARFIMLDKDIMDNPDLLKMNSFDKIGTTIIMSNSLSCDNLSFYKKFPGNNTFKFYVKSNEEYNSLNYLLQKEGIENFDVIPLFDGTNHEFFEENVYMTLDDLDNICLSKREVFANMTLNVHSFGKFTIMPEELVFSNVNEQQLGNINDSVYGLIYKEMTERKTWLRVRDMKPCSDCVFQWLCPSPGNFELVLDKPNLCNIDMYRD